MNCPFISASDIRFLLHKLHCHRLHYHVPSIKPVLIFNMEILINPRVGRAVIILHVRFVLLFILLCWTQNVHNAPAKITAVCACQSNPIKPHPLNLMKHFVAQL